MRANQKIKLNQVFENYGELIRKNRDQLIYPSHKMETKWDRIFLVNEGIVGLYSFDFDGKREIILEVIYPNRIFGEFAIIGGVTQDNLFAKALTNNTIVYGFESGVFLKLLKKSRTLAIEFLSRLIEKNIVLRKRIKSFMFTELNQRLIPVLLELKEFGGDDSGNICLTHLQIAQIIGSARENITLELNHLKRSGLLDKRRFQIKLKDEKKLKKLI